MYYKRYINESNNRNRHLIDDDDENQMMINTDPIELRVHDYLPNPSHITEYTSHVVYII